MTTAIAQLARFVITAAPEADLEPQIAPAVADCFGCILVGADSDVARRVTRALSPFGSGGALLYGTGNRASPPYAAQINAVAGHAWDLDDWEEPGNTHPSVVLVPALLAASSLRRTSGAALLSAYAIGAEIIMRLGEALTLDHYARGFHSTATLGAIGAAGAVARLMNLSEPQIGNALALAVSQATGFTLQFGSNAKPLQAGWAARTGIEAAILAAHGVTGQACVLDHSRGFAGLTGQYDGARFAHCLNRLGQPWALQEYGLILKPWPSCGYTHRLMTAALALRPRLTGRTAEIVEIHAQMPDFHAEILPFHQPISRAEALFSAQACIAQSLVSGTLTLADSEGRFWERPDIARLIPLVTLHTKPARRPDLNYDPDQPDILSVHLSNGEVLRTECAYPLGASQNPMSQDQLGAKFASLTPHTDATFQDVLAWPATPDVASFFQRMSS